MFIRVPAVIAIASLLGTAWAADEPRTAEAAAARDRFVAGGSVRQERPVGGDLIGVGGDFVLAAPVEGDAILAGGSIRVEGAVAQDLYAAGGKVTLESSVGRNARVAGGQLEVRSSARIDGNVSAAGGSVAIRGPVKGYVQAAGGDVVIDAAVGGDVLATSGQLRLGPNARIGGKVRYRGGDLSRDPGAQVAGTIEQGEPLRAGERHAPERGGFGGGWIWTAGLVTLAALIAGAFPTFVERVGAEIRARPGWAALAGFVTLVCVPVASVLLMVLVIGIPVALLVMLAYAALLLVGYVAAAITVGDGLLGRFRAEARGRTAWRMLAAMLAMLAIALLARIPILGGIVALAAILLGMGAIVMALWPGARPGSTAPGSPAA